ncbi:MAG: DNA mismatch repair endonuclease MutL [Clostridium sp.]
MKRIKILDINTSNKIAAGEVVERPFSVVKELVENSIDAGALNITVEIEEGGQKLIKVSDDGYGIHPEDIIEAFHPHATSKINSIEDIYSISTLGFRGEALPSIASVSKLKVLSKVQEFNYGMELKIDAGIIGSCCEKGCSNGTVIEVKDLFFNVPARRKFLKSTQREASIISDIITRLAISYPTISFKFINNNKLSYSTYGNDSLPDVIRTIYGKEVSTNLIGFEGHNDVASVYGYIGTAEISRGSRNRQSIFVNKRYIKNKLITTAVENAFKSFLTVNKFPFFILFVDIYAELIDVNVHPTKSEIKFQDDRLLFKVIFDSVHKGLSEDIKGKFKSNNNSAEKSLESSTCEEYIQNSYITPNNNDFVIKSSPIYDGNIIKESTDLSRHTYSSMRDTEINLPLDLKGHNSLNDNKNLNDFNIEKKSKKLYSEDTQSIDKDMECEAKFSELKVIGQFNSTYIIAEAFKELYLIDQHAAHEKILFEKYRESLKNSKVISQILITPVIIELSAEDYIFYIENSSVFEEAGFNVETFGTDTLSIREVPYILGKLDCKNLFIEILDNLKSLGSGKPEDVKYNKIASISCRAAVKAHDKLSDIEMNHLLNDLRYIHEPFTCPHGRPTIIKFSLYDIEKMFKRIQ